jgi:hypothetical protein
VRRLTGPPPRALIATILAVGAITALFLIGSPTHVEWYQPIDEDTVRIGVTTGGGGTWTWVRGVDETDERVTITVRTVTLPVPMASIGYALELTVELDRPLGSRTVVDGPSGGRVPGTECPDRPLATECRITTP